MVDNKSNKILCVAQAAGRRHDFRLFKQSQTVIHHTIIAQVDTGYQGQ